MTRQGTQIGRPDADEQQLFPLYNPQYFWNKVTVSGGCWEWQGSVSPSGYGQVWIVPPHDEGARYKPRPVRRFAHRLAYYLTHGSIDSALYVCHTCDNPRCVRPDHLYLGTAADNADDAVTRKRYKPHNREKTHCPKGHEYTPENTYIHTHGKYTSRACATCTKARAKKNRKTRSPGDPRIKLRKSHCKHGHPLNDDTVYWNVNGSWQCKECQRNRYLTRKSRSTNP